ncbi:hypothetical protein jhhlp_005196 [Lomentospora prolificans]|uniref:Protein phosphatase 4 core regulatory subunit R2 n=1 Tax=Lomentospora prolificans TaxID=41688 RepID=A0A2N3N733_9PEZI|nr:hypothetical protein jhhlp_005196 [Lomentospora prolificans]
MEPANLMPPLPSSPLERPNSLVDANKENADPLVEPPSQETLTSAPSTAPPADPDSSQDAPDSSKPATLPPQIQEMMDDIIASLRAFPTHPPHTIQRIAELILEPNRHYRALTSYLHALDRVVRVTSPSNRYPLPLPTVSFANGAADQVSWANTTQANLGTDEALGGALLTPIPWLSRQDDSPSDQSSQSRAELRTESTETIEGPNGMGSIETVSISVNGIPSAGAGAAGLRGITQGELLRQEQRAGIIPTNQLVSRDSSSGGAEEASEDLAEDEEETPHVRGPNEIGPSDLGPTILTINRIDDASLHPQEIDMEAAVGRKMVAESQDSPESDDAASDSGSKRGAEEEPEGSLSSKKPRSDSGDPDEAMEGVEETSELEKP